MFGHSLGGYVRAHDLSTMACLDLLLEAKSDYPQHTFVGFATNYDVNMICRDMSPWHVQHLWSKGRTVWRGYHLRYVPGKMFNVSVKGRKAAVLYDVFSFFGTSFVNALRSFKVGNDNDLGEIEYGKSRRGSFTDKDLDTLVVPYWQKELQLLVDLCEALRESLTGANIYLRDWYGPGAVANQILNRHKIKTHMRVFGPAIETASCTAYAGGRFEQFKLGRYEGKVYQYDIRSAYPAAIVRLPGLDTARYTYRQDQCLSPRFYDLCHVQYPRVRNGNNSGIHPFHWRYPNGNIAYPAHFDNGWHYGSVVEVARRHGLPLEVTEWYSLEHDYSQPFRFVGELYEQRAEWKRQGNPAQYAAKISLNSLYGKFAQQVGYNTTSSPKPPKYHQLEWAGMVTAQTRARIFDAMMQKPDAVIACETDSVFSTEPLDLPIGDALGEWELTEHDEIIYLQSGVYFTRGERHLHWKYRGMDKDTLSYDRVRQWLRDPAAVTLEVPMVRFMAMGSNLWNGRWCQWVPVTKVIDPLSVQSKRIHDASACLACSQSLSFDDALHTLSVHPLAGAGPSAPHRLAWQTGVGYQSRMLDEILSDD